jgi:hypothetical protein
VFAQLEPMAPFIGEIGVFGSGPVRHGGRGRPGQDPPVGPERTPPLIRRGCGWPRRTG